MALWWQSLTTLEHVLLYVAVPATLLLLVQTILLLLGGGGPGADLDGDGIPDGAADLDGDGIPDGWIDVDGDGIPDAPDTTGAPLQIFTLRGVVAFFALFGWGSLWLCQFLPAWLALFLGVQIGVAGMVGMALLVRAALNLQTDGTLRLRGAIGQTGSVYLTIPPVRSGRGKVTVLVQDQLREFEAETESSAALPTGSTVLVTGLDGAVLLVEPTTND